MKILKLYLSESENKSHVGKSCYISTTWLLFINIYESNKNGKEIKGFVATQQIVKLDKYLFIFIC